jgi:hypothetical protein
MKMQSNGFYLIVYLILKKFVKGFGSVFSAIWLDGIRKIEEIKIDNRDDSNYSYKRSREQNSTIALKTLSSSLREVS